MDKATFKEWFLEVYREIEVAKTFDGLKARDAQIESDLRLHKHDVPVVSTDRGIIISGETTIAKVS